LRHYLFRERALLVAVILLPLSLLGQNPGVAFISGDFSGWNKLEGTKYYGIGLQTLLTPSPSNNAFRLAAQSDTSAYGPNTDSLIKVVPAGFGHSMRLGNFVGGIEAERMTYTWTISEENAILSYKYALVSQELNHAPQWLPTVGFLVMDQDSAVI
jgi:hypothetical protein